MVKFVDALDENVTDSVQVGFVCLDGTGKSYRVKVINSRTFSSLNVDLIEYQNLNRIPVGRGLIVERFGSTYQIPNGLVNSLGISSVLQAKIINHNVKLAATNVQPPDTLYLQELSGTTAISDGDTILLIDYALKAYADSLHLADEDSDSTNELQNLVLIGSVLNITDGNAVDFASLLAGYLLKTDTTLTGYGLLKTGKTLRVDSSKIATRYFVGTNPTSIAAGQIAHSNGTNLVGSPNFTFGGDFVGQTGNSSSDVGYSIVNSNSGKQWVMSVAGSGNAAGSGNLYFIQVTNPYSLFGLDGANRRVIVNGGQISPFRLVATLTSIITT